MSVEQNYPGIEKTKSYWECQEMKIGSEMRRRKAGIPQKAYYQFSVYYFNSLDGRVRSR